MNDTAWVFAAIFAVAAVANWWSRLGDGRRRTELWSKPLALTALIAVAVALEPVDQLVRAWFVVALVWLLAVMAARGQDVVDVHAKYQFCTAISCTIRTAEGTAFPIGFVLSYVIMGTLFFAIITPIGLLVRLFAADPMQRKFDANARTYWTDCRQDRGQESYFKQF